MQIKSQSFTDGSLIPVKYTGDGEDVSPQLEWSQAPSQTKEFALICDDPDAPSPQPSLLYTSHINFPGCFGARPEGVPCEG